MEKQYFTLILGKDAFTDSAGITLSKADTLQFKTKSEAQYGSVRLHFNNLDLSKNPVLQVIQNKVVVQSVVLTANEWYQRLITPGQYQLRLLFDENKNGVWDAGNFKLHRQPEKVQRIPREITIKANWDNEADINL
ncbi:MAG: hypothetical protein ABI581_15675 [Sediminibacterium sp.]